jgi:hypothetical protein
LSYISSKLSRGVSKIDELDSQQVREIVSEVFNRGGLSPPYSIEFKLKESKDSKPFAYYEDDKLHVVASTEPELRRLIGRHVIETKWSNHEWLVMNHVGVYTLINATILTTLPAITFHLSWMITELRPWILYPSIIILSLFAFWTGYQVSIKSPKLINKLTIEMVDLGCMTEYDNRDYTADYHKIAVGGTVICIWGGLVLGIYGMMYYLHASFIFLVPLLLLCLAGLYFLFVGSWKSIDLNLCYETEYEDEEEWEARFEDNEYLQTRFTELIEKMDLQSVLQSKHEAEYETIRARFTETKYSQCRAVYDYVEEGILYIDCEDIDEAAAFRYGTALLTTASLRFYREVSFSRRAVHLWALFLGLCAPIVGILGAYMVSKVFGIGALVVASIIFIKLWQMGRIQYEEVRRDLPGLLSRTGAFKDYELEFYNEFMFSSSSRSEWIFLVVFLLLFWGLAFVLLIFS